MLLVSATLATGLAACSDDKPTMTASSKALCALADAPHETAADRAHLRAELAAASSGVAVGQRAAAVMRAAVELRGALDLAQMRGDMASPNPAATQLLDLMPTFRFGTVAQEIAQFKAACESAS